MNISQGTQILPLPQSLSTGVYIIRVSGKNHQEAHKIIL